VAGSGFLRLLCAAPPRRTARAPASIPPLSHVIGMVAQRPVGAAVAVAVQRDGTPAPRESEHSSKSSATSFACETRIRPMRTRGHPAGRLDAASGSRRRRRRDNRGNTRGTHPSRNAAKCAKRRNAPWRRKPCKSAFSPRSDLHGKERVAGSSPAEGFDNCTTARFSCFRSVLSDRFLGERKGSPVQVQRTVLRGTAATCPFSRYRVQIDRRLPPSRVTSGRHATTDGISRLPK
jgi:hypothetical protein